MESCTSKLAFCSLFTLNVKQPTINWNLQKRYLTCRECDTLQIDYPRSDINLSTVPPSKRLGSSIASTQLKFTKKLETKIITVDYYVLWSTLGFILSHYKLIIRNVNIPVFQHWNTFLTYSLNYKWRK
jgi:hypothetical protein